MVFLRLKGVNTPICAGAVNTAVFSGDNEICICRRCLLGLILVTIALGRLPLQDEDHSGSSLHSFLAFLFEIRDVSGTGPEWTRPCGFRRKSSTLDKVFKNTDFRPTDFLRPFRCHSTINFIWHLSKTIFLDSRRICVSSLGWSSWLSYFEIAGKAQESIFE